MEETGISPYSGGITAFENAQRVAASLAKSSLVPTAYQGQNGLANCIVALEIASRMRMSPLLVMQNLDVIYGRPSWKSSFLIGLINSCGKYTPLRFQYAGEGDERSCYATTSDKATGEVIDGPKVTIKMAKAQGWYGRSGSKWPDMPDLMLSYRAAAFWSRLHAPELVLGYQTAEEVIDVEVFDAPTTPPPVLGQPVSVDPVHTAPPDASPAVDSGEPVELFVAVVEDAPLDPAPDSVSAPSGADAHTPSVNADDSGAAVSGGDNADTGVVDSEAIIAEFKAFNKTSPAKAGAAYKRFLAKFGFPAGTPMTKAVTTHEHVTFLREQFSATPAPKVL